MTRIRLFLALPGFMVASLLCTALAAAAAELKPWSGGGTPPLVLRGIDGRTHDLAAYRGQVVLVNFWATWCEPCRDEMPSIQRLQGKLAGKPFAVLAVNLDEPESRIRNFLVKMPLDFPILVDEGKKVTRDWKVRVLPASFVIGRDGRIRYSLVGELAWDQERTVQLVSGLMSSR